MRDITFPSASLNRPMHYRVVAPIEIRSKSPIVYLLHGGGGNFRDWTNYSDVARFAEAGWILVMPEGDDSYYTNALGSPQNRYEDYIIKDLIDDVEHRFSTTDSSRRAVIGISMGGFGAVKLAFRHPEMFVFAAGISPALDVPSRPFSIKRPLQWRFYRSIFGPWNGEVQRENDPFVLARTADPKKVPYLYLTCGEQEGLLPANQKFAKLLEQLNYHYEFHVVPGGHTWNQWNEGLPVLFQVLTKNLTDRQH